MIKRDNRLLDGCFGKLKQLFISVMPSIFNSNAEFWPKNYPKNFKFLKKCSHALLRRHYITTLNFGVYLSTFVKFKQIYISNGGLR